MFRAHKTRTDPATRESGLPKADSALVEQHLRTGRPLGDDRFIDKAEQALGRSLRKQRPGPKPKDVPGGS